MGMSGEDFQLRLVTLTLAAWPQSLSAQPRPLGVCEALNSAVDHQAVVIHANLALTPHLTYVFDGTADEPCPGWRKRFITAPAAIPILIGSYSEVRVPDSLRNDLTNFLLHLRGRTVNRSGRFMVTISGVLIRKPWLLTFRGATGEYVGWGEGLYGGFAALLVVTSVPIEDR